MREWKRYEKRKARADGGMIEGRRGSRPSNGRVTPPPSLLEPIEPDPKRLSPHRDLLSLAKLQRLPYTRPNPYPPAPPTPTMTTTLSTPPNQTQVHPRYQNAFLLHPRRRHRPLVQETPSSITVVFQSPQRRRKAQRPHTGI